MSLEGSLPGPGGPPAPDESWWDSILKEGEAAGGSTEEAGTEYSHGSHRPGSPEDWDWARELFEKDDRVELPVIGYNRGGLLVEAKSLRGFVPISHIIDIQDVDEPAAIRDVLARKVGCVLRLKVIEHNPERGRLVFSERAALAAPGQRMKLLTKLQPGDQVSGKVTNITRFGVFVDLGGLEGLIHVSELSWGRVRHPEDVVDCGEEVEVKVLSIDRDQGRIALSLKELLPDPWVDVEERYHVGQVVEGIVTNVVRFGAFVGLEEGLEGLIHVSELGEGNFLHPRSVVDEGENVKVKVIHIDAGERRLGLSLRQISQREEEKEDEGEVYPEEQDLVSSY